jgi:ABC-type branched-subunit amino acid transport system ATPase component
VPQEVDELFDNLRELKAEGLTVIFISHKLDEVLKVADEITVIRRGTTVATVNPAETNARALAELMVGSELPSPETRESTVTDEPMLTVTGLTLRTPDGRALLEDIDFTIHKGEVLGIAGVEGNGQSELVETIMGMRHGESGAVNLGTENVSRWHTRRLREAGIGYIPEDRHRHGLLLEAPLWENRILGHQTQSPNVKGPWVDRKGARKDTERIVEQYDVRTPGIDVFASALSGGNQQKLIVGPGDERQAGRPHRGAPDPRRRRRRPGSHLGPHPHGSPGRAGGAADLSRPRRADRAVRPGQGDPARPLRRRCRPGARHARGARLGDDRCGGHGMSSRFDPRRILLTLAAPVIAVAFSILITSLVLLAAGDPVVETWKTILDVGSQPRSISLIINSATVFYLSALAVAIGFRMNLFNIGVDGQYRLGVFTAAWVGSLVSLPKPLHILTIVVVAMVVGALWAGIAGILKVHPRGERGHLDDHAQLHRDRDDRLLPPGGGRSRWRAATTSAPSCCPTPGGSGA